MISSLSVGMPLVCESSCSSVIAANFGLRPGMTGPSTSPMVESQRSLPSSIIMPASVAVIALVSEPM